MFHSFFKLLKKLVEIAMVHVLCFVEDECCFSLISFLRSKLCNHPNPHLQLVAIVCTKIHQTWQLSIPSNLELMVKCPSNTWLRSICLNYEIAFEPIVFLVWVGFGRKPCCNLLGSPTSTNKLALLLDLYDMPRLHS